MPSTGRILAVLATAFAITFALRAVPFAILKPLRRSRFVTTMAAWMPVGILGILAAATFRTTALAGRTAACSTPRSRPPSQQPFTSCAGGARF